MQKQHTLSQRPLFTTTADADRFEFLNHLASIRIAGSESGSMSVVEFSAPKGFGPPEHRHEDEDELFVILEGALRLQTGDLTLEAEEGGTAFLPKAQPHTFQVISGMARFLTITTSRVGAPQFDDMIRALGTPTTSTEMPEPKPIDPVRVAEINRAHRIEILGPPPAMT